MRSIIVQFPDRLEGFTSLHAFLSHYPEYQSNYESIVTAITRKKEPYLHQDFKLMRLTIQKAKK